MDTIITGGCRCGAIRYEARSEPLRVNHCHCLDCRGTSGAAFMTWATFKSKDVTFTKGKPKIFKSSDIAYRRFCGACGAQLVWAAEISPEKIDLTVATMDDPDRITPEYHLFTSRRIGWLHIEDGLPAFDEWKEH